jgi:hypothetical protein
MTLTSWFEASTVGKRSTGYLKATAHDQFTPIETVANALLHRIHARVPPRARVLWTEPTPSAELRRNHASIGIGCPAILGDKYAVMRER